MVVGHRINMNMVRIVSLRIWLKIQVSLAEVVRIHIGTYRKFVCQDKLSMPYIILYNLNMIYNFIVAMKT